MDKTKRLAIIYSAVLLVVALAGVSYWFFFVRQPSNVLWAKYVKEAPRIDGDSQDAVWRDAEPLTIPIQNGQPVTIKAVYTTQKVFFLATYKDSTKNNVDSIWEYDGQKWKVGPKADQLSLFFDVNDSIIGFKEKGFAVMNQGFSSGGTVYNVGIVTKAPPRRGSLWEGYKQKGDVWWLSAGFATVSGKANDMVFKVNPYYLRFPDTFKKFVAYVYFDRYDSDVPFVRNQITSWTTSNIVKGVPIKNDRPLYMFNQDLGLAAEDTPYPTMDQMVRITDYSVFKKGDELPRTIFIKGATWGGSFDDIDGRSSWLNRTWTAEMGRKLNTGHADDIVFKTGKDKSYGFGVLVTADGWTMRPSPTATLRFAPKEGG